MKLFTRGFIHLEDEDHLHQDKSLKEKLKFCTKNFLMGIKVLKPEKLAK